MIVMIVMHQHFSVLHQQQCQRQPRSILSTPLHSALLARHHRHSRRCNEATASTEDAIKCMSQVRADTSASTNTKTGPCSKRHADSTYNHLMRL